jgi:hypothetical protein
VKFIAEESREEEESRYEGRAERGGKRIVALGSLLPHSQPNDRGNREHTNQQSHLGLSDQLITSRLRSPVLDVLRSGVRVAILHEIPHSQANPQYGRRSDQIVSSVLRYGENDG